MRLLSLILLALLCVAAKPAPVQPEIVVVPGQPVTVTVRGVPITALPQADGFSTLVLNGDVAMRMGIKAGMIGGTGKIGPVKIAVSSAVVPYGVGTPEAKRRILWFAEPMAAKGDGALGPAAFPQNVVIFQLRPSLAGEREFSFPMTGKGASYGSLGLVVRDGDRDVLALFDLDRAHSIVSAPTANGLAARHGGTLSAATTREMIRMGVERPARRLTLATPFLVGPLKISAVMARTNDYGNANAIRSEDDDPDEIVVTGAATDKPQLIRIGAEDMAGCSRLTFDKVQKTIRLTCRSE